MAARESARSKRERWEMRITREAKARAVMYAAATGREIGEVVEGLIAANLPELPAEVAAMCGAA